MSTNWKEKWNERYSSAEFAYGTMPNIYFKQQLDLLSSGKILLPAEGEGRNGVYAATQGWTVCAFDISEEGKRKAELLARKNNTQLEYLVCDPSQLHYPAASFDVIALIFAHFPAPLKSTYHQQLIKLLKPGGIIIFEAFSKNHLNYNSKNEKVGGPKELGALFSIEEINHDFSAFEIIQLSEEVIELQEGSFHQGTGSVIRFVGEKNLNVSPVHLSSTNT